MHVRPCLVGAIHLQMHSCVSNTSTTPSLSLEERHRTAGSHSARRSRKSARPRSSVLRFGDRVQASSFAIKRVPFTGTAVRIFYANIRITTAHTRQDDSRHLSQRVSSFGARTPPSPSLASHGRSVAARQPVTSVDAAREIAIPVLLPQSPRRTGWVH